MVRVKVSRVPRLARQGAHDLFNNASFVPPPTRLRGRGVTIESLEIRDPYRSEEPGDADGRRIGDDEGVEMSLVPDEAIPRAGTHCFAGDRAIVEQAVEQTDTVATVPAEWPAAADVIVHPSLAGVRFGGVVSDRDEGDHAGQRSLQLFARSHTLQAA